MNFWLHDQKKGVLNSHMTAGVCVHAVELLYRKSLNYPTAISNTARGQPGWESP